MRSFFALSVFLFILSSLHAYAALPVAGWEKVIDSPADLTGTTTNDEEVYAFIEHRGLLYIGYYTAGLPNAKRAARLYTWDGQTHTLKYTFGTGLSFASLQALGEYKGNLYAAISGLYAGSGDIYVSADGGTTWAKSYEATSDYFCSVLVVFKDKLYAGMGYHASRILSFDGTVWREAYGGKNGSGLVEWMLVHRGRLYAALGGATAGKAVIISTDDGTNWTVEFDDALGSNFYSEVASLVEFRGSIFAGMMRRPGNLGGDLFVRNDSTGSWNLVWSNPYGNRIHAMDVYNDRLYIGNANMAGAGDVYVSDDGINFVLDLDTPLREVFRLYKYNGSLYMGAGFTNAEAQVWRKTDQVALRIQMRKLLEGQAIFTRGYFSSLLAKTSDVTVVKNTLLENHKEIAETLKPYYGDAASTQILYHLGRYIYFAPEFVRAVAAKDAVAIATAKAKWKVNTDALIMYLAGLNDYWSKEDIRDLLYKHSEYLEGEMTSRVDKNWTEDVRFFDLDRQTVLILSDLLTDGIVNQFPDKFKK